MMNKRLRQVRNGDNDMRSVMAVVGLVAIMLILSTVIGDVSAATAPVSGAAFRSKLQAEVGISTSGKPLRDALYDLSRMHGVAVLLDRRVDPGQPVEFSGTAPLITVIERLAGSAGLEAVKLDSVVFVGRSREADLIRTVAAVVRENKSLSSTARAKLLARKPIAWEDFAEPRQILQQLATESGIRWFGLEEAVPHDLWPAADWPAMTLADRLTLLLGQFGLSFQLSPDGAAIRPVPIPTDFGLVRDYPAGSDGAAKVRRFKELAPDAQIKLVGDKIFVKAMLADHDRLSGRAPTASGSNGGGQTGTTGAPPADATPLNMIRIDRLNIDNQPLRPILEHLAKNFKAQLRVDWAGLKRLGIEENRRTSIHVSGMTADKLFADVFKDLPVTVRVDGVVVEISPK